MELMRDFVLQFAWAIPLIVAATNWTKEQMSPASWSVPLIALVFAVVVIEPQLYFTSMPMWARGLVAAVALSGSASGVWDLVKVFGTIVAKPDHG